MQNKGGRSFCTVGLNLELENNRYSRSESFRCRFEVVKLPKLFEVVINRAGKYLWRCLNKCTFTTVALFFREQRHGTMLLSYVVFGRTNRPSFSFWT